MDEETLKSLKDIAALDFIPKAMIVCVLGNLINFVILSRYSSDYIDPLFTSNSNPFLYKNN